MDMRRLPRLVARAAGASVAGTAVAIGAARLHLQYWHDEDAEDQILRQTTVDMRSRSSVVDASAVQDLGFITMLGAVTPVEVPAGVSELASQFDPKHIQRAQEWAQVVEAWG